MALLYLVQHGEAKPESEDTSRPLSDKGRWDVLQVAKRLAETKPAIRMIIHSGKLRAKQTAEIFANHLKPVHGIKEMQGLCPNDSPIMASELANGSKEDIMLVGHLPGMDRLSSLLLTGDEGAGIISFRMAAVVCLERSEPPEKSWRIKWILPPELA
jgi:phosphohistidine phosphatase